MKKVIVTTTINEPTIAISKFQLMEDWHLIVVGDKKTPSSYSLKRGEYLSPEMQENLYPDLSRALGWNCIQRRNIGFLHALAIGADIIATVDDDNVPLEGWALNVKIEQEIEVSKYISKDKVFDPIAVTNYSHLWHRGFPLQYLQSRKYELDPNKAIEVFDIQADFWNGDPDIDAICRMEHAPDCQFDESVFPFTSNAFSPFNSQNTFLSRRVLQHYFMFPFVGRMDDIWAAYYVQALGFKVFYQAASVRQDRNVHDLTIDFEREVIGYLNNHKLITDIKSDPDSLEKYVGSESWEAFQIYRKWVQKVL